MPGIYRHVPPNARFWPSPACPDRQLSVDSATVIDLDETRCADWSKGSNQVLLQTTKTLINRSATDLEVSSIPTF